MTSLAIPPTSAPLAASPDTTYSLELGVDARGAQRARNAVRVACAGTALPGQVVDDSVHIAGELVQCSMPQTGTPVVLVVETTARRVTVRVRDAAIVAAGRAPAGALRSWELVRRLATSFGYRIGGRRELWATVRVCEDAIA